MEIPRITNYFYHENEMNLNFLIPQSMHSRREFKDVVIHGKYELLLCGGTLEQIRKRF